MTLLLGLFRFAVALFAIAMILLGAVLTPSPLPFGIVLIVLGLLLLATVAPAFVRFLRKTFRWFDKAMHWLEDHLPAFIARPLKVTDFEHPEDDEYGARQKREREKKQRRKTKPRVRPSRV
jgi:hypothetical protein